MSRYRIVTDRYCGYEVQIWRWWWPFWTQVNWCNTHYSVEHAEAFARAHAQPVVKYLGHIESRP